MNFSAVTYALAKKHSSGLTPIELTKDQYDILPQEQKEDASKLYFTTDEIIRCWKGFTNLSSSNIWTDGTNYYYSNGTEQYILNGTTWEPMTLITIVNAIYYKTLKY